MTECPLDLLNTLVFPQLIAWTNVLGWMSLTVKWNAALSFTRCEEL